MKNFVIIVGASLTAGLLVGMYRHQCDRHRHAVHVEFDASGLN